MKTNPRHRLKLITGMVLSIVFGVLFDANPGIAPALAGNAGLPATAAPHDPGELINLRLGYMKDVAAYKWIHGIPIEDLQREAQVIAAARNSGLRYGLTVSSSEAFFGQQILAAKEIQRYWFQIWQETSGPTQAPGLSTVIRPRLIELGNQITAALAQTDMTRANLHIQAEGLSDASADELAASAASIKRYATQLDQVVDSKTLRVGTTYDYAPFSFRNNGASLGIDVSLAKNLAASLGAELVLVETSWPTLMADLAAGHFDIGMSGISINLERQKVALFSTPHHRGGKTPISRCEDVAKFDQLEKIDQPETRIIVNPGGTNQRFVDANIESANVTIHADNRTIFKEIEQNNADVMITDAIEVALQTNLLPGLCATMPGATLTHQEKGFLLPRDLIWKQYVDTWLAQRTAEGEVAKLFKQFLAPSS